MPIWWNGKTRMTQNLMTLVVRVRISLSALTALCRLMDRPCGYEPQDKGSIPFRVI